MEIMHFGWLITIATGAGLTLLGLMTWLGLLLIEYDTPKE